MLYDEIGTSELVWFLFYTFYYLTRTEKTNKEDVSRIGERG